MSWNKKIHLRLFALLFAGWFDTAVAADVCPLRHGAPLRFVDVFDGSPEELATLIPDKAQKFSGYWQLGYVYDAGRLVTIRCKYADGQASDVKLPNKIAKCDYKIDAKKTLSLSCK